MPEEGSFRFECAPPFLVARFPEPQRTLGWTLLQPGFVEVCEVVWVEVKDADLTPDVDPCAFLRGRLAGRGFGDALAFMTSRDIRRHHFHRVSVAGITAACLTTVGLSNAVRIGTCRPVRAKAGTINTLVHVSSPLTDGAFIEALSIATEARTTAIIETRLPGSGPPATGTGTDCIVVAAPVSGDVLSAAGLHTALGEAVGAAVYGATRAGAEEWNAEFPELPLAHRWRARAPRG